MLVSKEYHIIKIKIVIYIIVNVNANVNVNVVNYPTIKVLRIPFT